MREFYLVPFLQLHGMPLRNQQGLTIEGVPFFIHHCEPVSGLFGAGTILNIKVSDSEDAYVEEMSNEKERVEEERLAKLEVSRRRAELEEEKREFEPARRTEPRVPTLSDYLNDEDPEESEGWTPGETHTSLQTRRAESEERGLSQPMSSSHAFHRGLGNSGYVRGRPQQSPFGFPRHHPYHRGPLSRNEMRDWDIVRGVSHLEQFSWLFWVLSSKQSFIPSIQTQIIEGNDDSPINGLLGILLFERDNFGGNLFEKSERSWASPSQIRRLPERDLSEEDLKRNKQDASGKCMVCLTEYEPGEAVRTMPCRNFFVLLFKLPNSPLLSQGLS